MYNYEGEAEDQAMQAAEPESVVKADRKAEVAERNRVDAERWRAIEWMVKDARFYLPIYIEQGRTRDQALAEGILRVYAPLVDVVGAEVHPDECGAHTWSRKTWKDSFKNGRGVVQWINLLALRVRRAANRD